MEDNHEVKARERRAEKHSERRAGSGSTGVAGEGEAKDKVNL